MKHRSWNAIPVLLSLALVPAAQGADGARGAGHAGQGTERQTPGKQGEKPAKQGTKRQKGEKPQGEKPRDAKPPKKAKMEERAPLTVVLPVTGATPANTTRTVEALQGMKQAGFHCESCDYAQATPGACPNCEKALAKGPERARIHRAVFSADDHELALTMAPGHGADLALIEAGLAHEGVKVDRQAFAIPAYSLLVLAGGNQEKAAALQKSLNEAKLFQEVTVRFAEPAGRIYVTPKVGPAKVELGRFTEALKRADPALRVENVEWCSPCPSCAQKGMLTDGCPVCCPTLKT